MNYDKIAPGLLSMFDELETEGRPALHVRARTFGLSHMAPLPKPPSVVVFLKCDPDANLRDLDARLGVRVNQESGRVRTAYLPIERLGDLSDVSAVERIIPSRYMHLKMDVAAVRCQIPAYRRRTQSSGRGVIVGVIDSGIDPNHPAFNGRIRSIWDQTLTGNGVQEGGYGFELTGQQLAASR